MKRLGAFLIIGLLAVIVALLAGIYVGTQSSDTIQQSSPTPDAAVIARFFASSLDDVDGKPFPFAQWQGKTLVVNFWATWCPPCREEMPAFSRLQSLYSAKGVQFVGIALDSAESVRSFSERYPVNYPLLIGGSRGVDLAQQFGNSNLGLPYTVILGPGREVRLLQLGPLSESELDRFLQESALR
ncbi:TlpA disulfide reductase family protein [Accumulibacter sp.]|uniref:TlpA family protein disulfide reductase n=1 Tax=Accumulibacter sp. TaxID=2053492 RepID=UPI0028C4AC02|nr:TlpA disulfide reductase family protein [Accumulibacter sp.]